MKEQLHKLIDGLNENQIIYSFVFLSKLFGRGKLHETG